MYLGKGLSSAINIAEISEISGIREKKAANLKDMLHILQTEVRFVLLILS